MDKDGRAESAEEYMSWERERTEALTSADVLRICALAEKLATQARPAARVRDLPR